jgi:hypothetical protein
MKRLPMLPSMPVHPVEGSIDPKPKIATNRAARLD